MISKDPQYKGLALATIGTFFASTVPVFSKVLLGYVTSPFALFLRMSTALFILLFVTKFVLKQRLIFTKQGTVVALFGALNLSFFIFGINFMPTIFTPVFYSLVPIQTTLLAWIIFRDKINGFKLIGILLGLSGTLIILSESFSHGSTSEIQPLGVIFLSTASISIALYGLLIDHAKKGTLPSAYNVTLQSIFFGLIFSLPIVLLFSNAFEMQKPVDFGFVMALIGLAGFGTIMQYVLYQNAIKLIGKVATVLFFYLQPVFVVGIGALFLHETVTWLYPVGMVLVLLGSSLNINFVLEKLRLGKNFRLT